MALINSISMDKFYSVGMDKFTNTQHHKLFSNSNQNTENQFYNICYDVMMNKKINVLEFEYILGSIFNTNKNPYEILFNVFKNYTNYVQQNIQNKYINYQFTNEYLITEYNNYVSGCMKLKKLHSKLDKFCKNNDKTKSINKNKSINIIYLLSNYWFYKNVLETKYIDKNGDKFVQDILDFKNINNNENKLMEFVNLLKIFGFYNNFVKSFQSNEILLQENGSFDISKNITDMNIYNNIVEQIDKNIKSFSPTNNNLEK